MWTRKEGTRRRVAPVSRARAMGPTTTVAGDNASTSSAGQKRKEPEAPSSRGPAYEGTTTRVVRRRKNDADEDLDVEEVVQMISVREGDELLSLGATGEEEWVRVHEKRVYASTPVVTCSTRYLNDAKNFELGGYAVSANGNDVLCSLPPPYVSRDTRNDRATREAYTDEETDRQFDMCGAVEGKFCDARGVGVSFKQGFHVASLSASNKEWKDRVQSAINQELGTGFEVFVAKQRIHIRNTRTGDVQVFGARRGCNSTVEFAGSRFYGADGGDGEVPIYSLDSATTEVYRQLEEEKYVAFSMKDPVDLVQADENRQDAMRADADVFMNGTTQFLGAVGNLILGLPIGTRREPVQLVENSENSKELELQCLQYYLLGFWFGDGCVSPNNRNDWCARFAIGVEADEDVAHFIAQANRGETCVTPNGNGTDLAFFLDKLKPLKAVGYCQQYYLNYDARNAREPGNCITLRILSRTFTEWLRSLGVICRKGDGQYEDLVKEILRLPKSVRKSFVAGCIDSDGSRDNVMSKETLVFRQAVDGGIDQSRNPNSAFNHDKIFALFGVIAASIPLDVRYRFSRSRVGAAFANVRGAPEFDARRRNAGQAYILSPDEVVPSSMPRKTNKRFPGKFVRLGSTFGVWRDPKRSAECVELTVGGATGHLLLANGTVVAVNRYTADDASNSEKID